MQKEGNVLIVDDNQDILSSSRMILKKHFAIVHTLNKPEKLPEIIKEINYDVVLLDLNFSPGAKSGKEGKKWLDYIVHHSPGSQIIIITAYGDINLAVECMKLGAIDFVVKPWNSEKLKATVKTAYLLSKSKNETTDLKNKQKLLTSEINKPSSSIIGTSESMLKVLEIVTKVAKTEANVLITGENGTGKELVARELHNQSKRKDSVFISVDLGSIPESLFEAELFGFCKGAFTDAKEDKPGRFELANGGTLFLDEIGNLSFSSQAKLLGALQNKKINRLGSANIIDLDIRLICATNKPLRQMVKENTFREDLLYRINTVEIHIPPLRERQNDVILLAKHYLNYYCSKYSKNQVIISKTTEEKLKNYNWPGNIRELQHLMERTIIMNDKTELCPEDFHIELPQADFSISNTLNIEELEKTAIKKAITKHNGNLTTAAKELGLGRTTLYRKMEKYGL